MWRLRVFLGLSYPEIGAVLKRDHSTVIYGVEEHERRMAARGNA
jgi:chromosomal replication initiation ATPase DnaA